MAFAEIFGAISGLEFAFTQAPSSMKSIIMALFLFALGIGNALNFLLVPFVTDPKILWMYASISILAFAMGSIFFLIFRNQREKDEKQ